MTGALTVYSATFMRYSLAVSPKNYLLFGCHLINFSAQATQGYRYLNYWKYVFYLYSLPCVAVRERKLMWENYSWGGREAQLAKGAEKGKEATEAGA